VISRPLRSRFATLSVQQQAFLRKLFPAHMAVFADFVGPEHNWLPTGQLPGVSVSDRGRPHVAHEYGGCLLHLAHTIFFLRIHLFGELLQRTDRALKTMEKLERFRGHFYNWYDTQTLLPLNPEYVSSVDSGNLSESARVARRA